MTQEVKTLLGCKVRLNLKGQSITGIVAEDVLVRFVIRCEALDGDPVDLRFDPGWLHDDMIEVLERP